MNNLCLCVSADCHTIEADGMVEVLPGSDVATPVFYFPYFFLDFVWCNLDIATNKM